MTTIRCPYCSTLGSIEEFSNGCSNCKKLVDIPKKVPYNPERPPRKFQMPSQKLSKSTYIYDLAEEFCNFAGLSKYFNEHNISYSLIYVPYFRIVFEGAITGENDSSFTTTNEISSVNMLKHSSYDFLRHKNYQSIVDSKYNVLFEADCNYDIMEDPLSLNPQIIPHTSHDNFYVENDILKRIHEVLKADCKSLSDYLYEFNYINIEKTYRPLEFLEVKAPDNVYIVLLDNLFNLWAMNSALDEKVKEHSK